MTISISPEIKSDFPIIYVDGMSEITDIMQEFLETQGYNNVKCFNKSQEALDYIKNTILNQAILITEFVLPDINGYKLIKESENINKNISTILTYGSEIVPMEKKVMKESITHIQKPFPLKEINQLIENKIANILKLSV